MNQMGSPMGSGNPPGKHSESYLSSSEGMHSQFMESGSYQAHMDVGQPTTAKDVGNQPKENRTSNLEAHANKTSSI